MGDLSTYRLSDFILFSQETYFRQFELYNQSIWPLHFVAAVFVYVILYALWKQPAWAGRVIGLLLVICWVWVAAAFLYRYFLQIHVVADWYARAFVLQAGLIAWLGVARNRFARLAAGRFRQGFGTVLLLVSLFVYPFIALVTGRSWLQFEMFALTPDPTVLVTLALLLLLRAPIVLYVIPVLWVIISSMTLMVM